MAKATILYRGSLKSCNYDCSYCPFSKHGFSEKELERDREQWTRFYSCLEKRSLDSEWEAGREPGAVMVVPYGEALIHPWYWEGLALLSNLESIEAVGAQTNLSFSTAEMLSLFERLGGRKEKLRLWATFHPQMTSSAAFADRCKGLVKLGVRISAGAVGVPGHLEQLGQLRRALPEDIYLWINRMDGLKRPYTPAEEAAFMEIDPFFVQELKVRSAKPGECKNRLFVEGGGSMRLCNISRLSKASWYDNSSPAVPACGRGACACFLAYGGRRDYENRMAFGRYPLFRIPWKPKAAFLDIDGTLLPVNKNAPEPEVIRRLKALSSKCLLFFATSLCFHDAMKRCREFSGLFSGGVFAGGAHVLFISGGEEKEAFTPLASGLAPLLKEIQRQSGAKAGKPRFRLLVYRNQESIYKLTLARPASRPWSNEDVLSVLSQLPPGSFRHFTEGNVLELVAPQANKAQGLRSLCALAGICPEEALAAGNSEEDISMFQVCGYGIAAPGSPESVQRAADMIWSPGPGD